MMSMMKVTVKFEAYGRRFQAKRVPLSPDWSRARNPYGPDFAHIGFDLIERPSFNADGTEWTSWRKASITLAKPIIEGALELLGLGDEKAAFSQRRLCKCGCSPAFIMKSSWHVAVYVEEVK